MNLRITWLQFYERVALGFIAVGLIAIGWWLL